MAGKIVHFELPAADSDRESGFWSGLFGWEIGGSAMERFDSLWQADPNAA